MILPEDRPPTVSLAVCSLGMEVFLPGECEDGPLALAPWAHQREAVRVAPSVVSEGRWPGTRALDFDRREPGDEDGLGGHGAS